MRIICIKNRIWNYNGQLIYVHEEPPQVFSGQGCHVNYLSAVSEDLEVARVDSLETVTTERAWLWSWMPATFQLMILIPLSSEENQPRKTDAVFELKLWEREREMSVPLSIALHTHSMDAIRQHYFIVQLHANPTFFFSFSFYLRILPSFFIISSPIPFHTHCLLFSIFHICDPTLELQQRRKDHSCP